MLFPQVLQIVRQYAKPLSEGGRIEYNGIDSREIGLERYVQIIVERLYTAIRPGEGKGESPMEIVTNLIEANRGTVSLPFEIGDDRRIAVKIVDDRGIEGLKIMGIN